MKRIIRKKNGRLFRKNAGLLLTVLLAVSMIPFLPAAAAEKSFEDVKESDWFYDPVMYVCEKGLMKGTAGHTFEPRVNMSRAMLVTVLHRMEGEPSADTSSFGDVGEESWFADAVGWASAEGIVKGVSAQVFDPFSPVSREQLAAIMYRYAEKKNYDVSGRSDLNSYADADAVSSWAEDSMAWAVKAELVNGFDDHTLAPQKEAGRGQVAAILQRFCEKVAVPDPGNDPGGNPDENVGLSFTDSLIRQMPKDKNWTVSPYSLEMCMAMVANGARGQTQEEILEAMQIGDLNSYNESVRNTLETYKGFSRIMSLETSNSVWLNQDQFAGKGSFRQSFTDILKLNYLAKTGEVWNRNSIETVNQWAEDATNGKISQILDEEHRDFAVALANAVYFKAAWMNPFLSEQTAPRTFYNQDGSEKEIPFMNQTELFPYYEEEGLQILEMPYRNYLVDEQDQTKMKTFMDADFSMYLLLSEDEPDLQEVLDRAVFQKEKVCVSIPKFKTEYGDSLVEELEALGITTAFDSDRADFSDMIDLSKCPWVEGLYLDEVLQKACLDVDEEGTEAAAVTVAIIRKSTTSLPTDDMRTFTADHPFYYVIRDNSSGRILFAGRYQKVPGESD